MKLKDKQHLTSMSKEELATQLRDVEKQIKELELTKYTKPVKNMRAIRTLREKSAVIQTKMNEILPEVAKEK